VSCLEKSCGTTACMARRARQPALATFVGRMLHFVQHDKGEPQPHKKVVVYSSGDFLDNGSVGSYHDCQGRK
jgi:hypothetical protein